jgi:uncharacterized membrane protein
MCNSRAATIVSPAPRRTGLGHKVLQNLLASAGVFEHKAGADGRRMTRSTTLIRDDHSMKVWAAAVAVAVAVLLCGVAAAQPAPPFGTAAPGAAMPPQGLPPVEGRADIWGHLTPDQRKELWQRLTPEERAAVWRRLTPEQRQAIRERLTPEQRQALRERSAERPEQFKGGPGPGQKLSPEQRRSLRDAIRDAHRESRHGRGGRPQ